MIRLIVRDNPPISAARSTLIAEGLLSVMDGGRVVQQIETNTAIACASSLSACQRPGSQSIAVETTGRHAFGNSIRDRDIETLRVRRLKHELRSAQHPAEIRPGHPVVLRQAAAMPHQLTDISATAPFCPPARDFDLQRQPQMLRDTQAATAAVNIFFSGRIAGIDTAHLLAPAQERGPAEQKLGAIVQVGPESSRPVDDLCPSYALCGIHRQREVMGGSIEGRSIPAVARAAP